MKKINNLNTPSFIVDLDILENNINKVQSLCHKYNKTLCPMTKTHKSTKIAKMQFNKGSNDFLVGTIDEARFLEKIGVKSITFAYPVTNISNIRKIIEISKNTKVFISVDSYEGAKIFNDELEKNNIKLDYFIIVNSGLNRLGVDTNEILDLAKNLSNLSNLNLIGISTHPGQVYGVNFPSQVKDVFIQEYVIMKKAYQILIENNFNIKYVATGSTPTFEDEVKSNLFNIIRPGNYIFNDNIQLSLNVCSEGDCAFMVLATIISKPKDNLFIIEAGSKCLGLDKGAHGVSLIKGFGKVVSHDELNIISLSEEVGKVEILGDTRLKVGDKIKIIPNHSCSSANMTNFLIGCRGDDIVEIIEIDARGNSSKPMI